LKRGSTRSHPLEISIWKRLWICPKADCGVVMLVVVTVVVVMVMMMMMMMTYHW